MIRIYAEYQFDIMGDGVTKEMLIPLRPLIPPEPLPANIVPTAILDVTIGAGPGGGSATLEGESARVVFDNAPSAARPTTRVTLSALFGTDRIE